MQTYNQIIKRIKGIANAQRQIRNVYKGLVTDFLTDKKTLYPSVFLNDNGNGSISSTTRSVSFPFRMFVLDLVNISGDAKDNEQDVGSDMMLIAIDLVAQLSSPLYTDWRISKDVTTQFAYEDENDYVAGVMLDFTVSIPYIADKCQAPFDDSLPLPIDNETKEVLDMEYIATPSEGSTLTIPALAGKKILLVIRENAPLHKVSNSPASTEFTWDNTNINLGMPINPDANPGERFLILYRNY